MGYPPKVYDFREHTAPEGFRNINDLGDLSTCDWLHPVQSLYGDWTGSNLILGQDFNSWGNLVDLDTKDLTHDPSFPTNINLIEIFGPSFDAIYANLSWFIKEGKSASSRFHFTSKVLEANHPILKATIMSMPNLRRIYCLGEKVFEAIAAEKYQPLFSKRLVLFGTRVDLIAIPHPGFFGMLNFRRKKNLSKDASLEEIKKYVCETQLWD